MKLQNKLSTTIKTYKENITKINEGTYKHKTHETEEQFEIIIRALD
jgi:hypothetical protein